MDRTSNDVAYCQVHGDVEVHPRTMEVPAVIIIIKTKIKKMSLLVANRGV